MIANGAVPTQRLAVTKFRPPPLPSPFVPRHRLVAAIDAAVRRRLTTISAPAGYGKSVALAAWAGQRATDEHLAWLRLDASDDTGSRIAGTALTALRRSGAIEATSPLASLTPQAAAQYPSAVDFLAELLNALGRLARPVILVIDDAHLLTRAPTLRALDYVLEFAPETVHLVLACRAEPAVRLPRLRLVGEVADIRADDLAFTPEETARLLAAKDLLLDEDSASRLHSLTLGWPAGVSLAAGWLSDPANAANDLATALESGAVTARYFHTEVLSELPAETLAALSRLAVADEFDGELAVLLTDDEAVRGRLAELSRQNPFVASIDAARSWFRWHPLLRAVLYRELTHTEPDRVSELHRRAATWLSEHHKPVAAVQQAQRSQDPHFLAALLAGAWLELIGSDSQHDLRAVLDMLPRKIVAEHPELSIARAALHLVNGSLSRALPLLDEALAYLERIPDDRRSLAASLIAAMRLYCSETGAAPAGARDAVLAAMHSLELDDLTPAVAAASRQFLSLALAVSDRNADPAESFAELRRIVRNAQPTDSLTVVIDTQSRLAALTCYSGALDTAAEQACEVLEESGRRGWERSHGAGLARMTMSWVQFLQGNGDGAREHLRRAIAILADQDAVDHCLALRLMALLLLSEGSVVQARGVLHEAYTVLASERISSAVGEALLAAEADVLLAEGDYLAALRLATDPDRRDVASLHRPGFVVAADAQLHMDSPRAALQTLAPWIERRDIGFAARVGVRVLQAIAEDALGRGDAAVASLSATVGLAAPVRLVRPLLDSYDRLHPLLVELAESGHPDKEFVLALLATGKPRSAPRLQQLRLPEPLTPREEDILRYLRSRLSLMEIATALQLSPNTVKTHVKHVYEKLRVTGRQEAIERATELNLL